MKDIHQQLLDIKRAWEAITTVPEDLTSWGFPDLTKQSISDTFGGMAELSQQLEQKKFTPLPTSKAVLVQVLTNLKTYVNTHIPPNPQPHIPGFLLLIEQARVVLIHMYEEADGQTRRVYGAAAERLAIALSRISDATQLYDEIVSSRTSALIAKNEANDAAENAESSAKRATQLETNAEENIKSISELLSTITDQKNVADDNVESIEKSVRFVADLNAELESGKKAQQTLFAEFEEYRQQANAILERTNQASLAGSFITRKRQLRWVQTLWGALFLASITGLTYLGIKVILPSIDMMLPSEHSADMWQAILLRLPLTAPIIWLGWFSARHYGFTVRLIEDYAFKAATAMAFDGYKREANEAGVEIQQMLLQTAIYNFGENPLRIFDEQANHASPMHELLDKFIRNDTARNPASKIQNSITTLDESM